MSMMKCCAQLLDRAQGFEWGQERLAQGQPERTVAVARLPVCVENLCRGSRPVAMSRCDGRQREYALNSFLQSGLWLLEVVSEPWRSEGFQMRYGRSHLAVVLVACSCTA